jgi:hypothetical protein
MFISNDYTMSSLMGISSDTTLSLLMVNAFFFLYQLCLCRLWRLLEMKTKILFTKDDQIQCHTACILNPNEGIPVRKKIQKHQYFLDMISSNMARNNQTHLQ